MGSGGCTDQHFCLRWNNFHSNIATSFEQLRDHEDFVDVTLACEGRTIKAHKVVLSACSPYFRSLLKQNPCQHPIIILRDVAFVDVSALLSFVYQGEVYVSQDRLSTFLHTAELLQIKGLTEQQQQHSSSTTHTGAITSTSNNNNYGSNVSAGIAVSLLPPPGGATAPLTHLIAAAPQQPPTPTQQSPHPAARGVPRSPSPTRPHSSPSPPPPPPPHIPPYIHPPGSHHISPPPKKRKHITSPLSSTSSSEHGSSTQPASPSDNLSLPPPPPLATPKLEPGGIIGGSTLAAALTAPRDSPHAPLPPPSPHVAPPPPPPALLLPPLVEVKQELSESPTMLEDTNSNASTNSDQGAVNLVLEGGTSILRQRIQGFQGSPDAPPPPSYRSAGDDEGDDSSKESLNSSSAVAIIRRQHQMFGLAAAVAGVYSGGGGGTALTGGCNTGTSDSSTAQQPPPPQEDNPYEARPCPVCHKSISNRANLKKHLKIRHSEQEEVTCPHCHKPFRNKYSLWTHVNSYHPQAKAAQHSLPQSTSLVPCSTTAPVSPSTSSHKTVMLPPSHHTQQQHSTPSSSHAQQPYSSHSVVLSVPARLHPHNPYCQSDASATPGPSTSCSGLAPRIPASHSRLSSPSSDVQLYSPPYSAHSNESFSQQQRYSSPSSPSTAGDNVQDEDTYHISGSVRPRPRD